MALAAAVILPAAAQNQRPIPRINAGIGPVEQISSSVTDLPEKAQNFLSSLFPDSSVAAVKNDFKDREYEVTMSNGYEIDFNYDGTWTQVDAPDGETLPSSALVAIIPEDVVIETFRGDDLVNGGMISSVEEITVIPSGYLVEYVTGNFGKGKAAVSKTDGKVLSRDKAKSAKRMRQAKLAHKSGNNKYINVNPDGGYSRMVRFTPPTRR